jgi:hypothetical protein
MSFYKFNLSLETQITSSQLIPRSESYSSGLTILLKLNVRVEKFLGLPMDWLIHPELTERLSKAPRDTRMQRKSY